MQNYLNEMTIDLQLSLSYSYHIIAIKSLSFFNHLETSKRFKKKKIY